MSSSPREAKKHDDMFKSTQWNDVWAAIAWGLNTLVALGVAGWAIAWLWKHPPRLEDPSLGGDGLKLSSLLPYLGVVLTSGLLLSALLSVIALGLVRRYPEQSIKGAYLANAGLLAVSGLGSLVMALLHPGSKFFGVAMGIFYLLAAGLTLLFLYWARNRIPFSAILMRTVVGVGREYPAMFGVATVDLAVTVLMAAMHVGGLLGLGSMREAGRLQHGPFIAAIVHQAFSLFWTQQVATNVAQTTVAGVYASYYFLAGSGMTVLNPTREALGRACTYSLGSICLGSLMVAIIQTLRFCLEISHDRETLAGAIADCLLSCLEGLVQYFNYYAYTFIAIYGQSYLEAASATWQLVTTRGVDALLNDQLVGTVMGLLVLFVSLCSGLTAFLTCLLWSPWSTALLAGLLAMLLGALIPGLLSQVISAGVTCTFVCYAEDPAALQRTKPELYAQFHERHSQL